MGKRDNVRSHAFVLEVDGRAVLAFFADSIEHASDVCAQDWLTEELGAYRSRSRPILNRMSELKIRRANAAEAAELDIAFATERTRGEYEGFVFAFLVPVDATRQ
jgi:hypothetical protein